VEGKNKNTLRLLNYFNIQQILGDSKVRASRNFLQGFFANFLPSTPLLKGLILGKIGGNFKESTL